MQTPVPRLSAFIVLGVATLTTIATVPSSLATTYVWQGGAASNDFSQPGNWTNDAAPSSNLGSTDLLFNASNGHPYPNAQVAYSLDSLTFSSLADGYNIGGSALTFGAGGITQNSASAENISNPVSLAVAQSWIFGGTGTLTVSNGVDTAGNQLNLSVASGVTATLSANIGGSGIVSTSGSGTMTLNGTNSYTGATILAAGILSLGSAGALNGTSSLLFQGGTLQYTSANTTDYSARFSTATGQTVSIDTNGQNVTFATALNTAGNGLAKYGAGTLTLSATNTFSGATQIYGGTITVSSETALENSTVNLSGGTLAFTSMGPFSIYGVGGLSGSGNLVVGTNASTPEYVDLGVGNNNQSTTYSGSLSGPGALEKDGTGNLLLTGANSLGGGLNVAVGTVTIGTGGSFNGTTIDVNGALTINGTVSGCPSLLMTGGSVTLNTGGIFSATTASIGDGGNATFYQSGGTATVSGALELGLTDGFANVVGNGTYSLSGGSLTTGTTYVGYNAGASTFSQTGGTHTTGQLVLANAASGSGTYNLDGGFLQTGSVSIPSGGGTGTFNFNGGTLQATGTSTTFFQGLTTANVQTNGAKINTGNFNVTVAQDLVHDTTGSTSGLDGGLTKLGGGTLTLTGTNSYDGGTTIDAGTLSVTNDSQLGDPRGAVTIQPGAALVFTDSTVTTGRTYNLDVATLSPASGGTITYSGATLNGGTLGAGNQVLRGNTTLNGTRATTGAVLSQSIGTVAFDNVFLTGTSTFTQTGGLVNATGDFTANAQTTLSVNGNFNLAGGEVSGALTIGHNGDVNDTSASLYLDGSRGTTVNSGGRLEAGSGTTIELGGLLTNNGRQTGTLNVNLGGVVRGTGTFGTVNVNNGATFGVNAPAAGLVVNGLSAIHLAGAGGLAGTSPAFVGPQVAAAPGGAPVVSLPRGSGSTFAFNVQDAGGAAGSGYDTVHASGVLTLSAGTMSGSQITVNVASLGTDGTSGSAANFDPTKNYSLVLVQAAGGIVGFSTGEFAVNASGFENATDGGTFSVVQDGNNLDLDFNPVPEPGTWVLLLVGAGGALLGVRRQRGQV